MGKEGGSGKEVLYPLPLGRPLDSSVPFARRPLDTSPSLPRRLLGSLPCVPRDCRAALPPAVSSRGCSHFDSLNHSISDGWLPSNPLAYGDHSPRRVCWSNSDSKQNLPLSSMCNYKQRCDQSIFCPVASLKSRLRSRMVERSRGHELCVQVSLLRAFVMQNGLVVRWWLWECVHLGSWVGDFTSSPISTCMPVRAWHPNLAKGHLRCVCIL